MRVRIIATPPGPAPESVRKAWIGLILPLAPGESGPRKVLNCGKFNPPTTWPGVVWHVLTGGQARWEANYLIVATEAIEILEQHAPFAATWWRENVPRLVAPGQHFGFAAEVCEVMADE